MEISLNFTSETQIVKMYNGGRWRSLDRQNHTKINHECITTKRWLRGQDIRSIQKISDARTIKNRWLRTKTSAICADKNHIKISDEYIIKKR